jgi:hypothetical protein
MSVKPTSGFSMPQEHPIVTCLCPRSTSIRGNLLSNILQGYNATLVKDKKWAFIPYGFHIGFYMVKDTVQAKQEGLSQLEF